MCMNVWYIKDFSSLFLKQDNYFYFSIIGNIILLYFPSYTQSSERKDGLAIASYDIALKVPNWILELF